MHRLREPRRPRDLGEFVTWVEHMNADMLAAGVELGDRLEFDLVHRGGLFRGGRHRRERILGVTGRRERLLAVSAGPA